MLWRINIRGPGRLRDAVERYRRKHYAMLDQADVIRLLLERGLKAEGEL